MRTSKKNKNKQQNRVRKYKQFLSIEYKQLLFINLEFYFIIFIYFFLPYISPYF